MINHMIVSYISCLALGWGLLFFDWALNEVERHPKAEPWISNAVTIGGASAVLSPIIQWGHAVAYSSTAVSFGPLHICADVCTFPDRRVSKAHPLSYVCGHAHKNRIPLRLYSAVVQHLEGPYARATDEISVAQYVAVHMPLQCAYSAEYPVNASGL